MSLFDGQKMYKDATWRTITAQRRRNVMHTYRIKGFMYY